MCVCLHNYQNSGITKFLSLTSHQLLSLCTWAKSVQFSCSVVSDSLRPHGLQHARPPCPSPTPRVYSNSCPLSRWCHPVISSSVIPFSSCLQSFPTPESFQKSQFFASGGRSIGVSASASLLPMNIQDWFPLGWTGWISLHSKKLSFKHAQIQISVPQIVKYFSVCCLVEEKALAPHSSTLVWKIPWTEEPGRLQSMRSLRVRHDWATSLSPFTFMHWRRKWQPTPVFLPAESQGRSSPVGCHLWGCTESDTTEAT